MNFDKETILKLIESFPRLDPVKTICVHPNNVEYFSEYPLRESMIVSDAVSEFAEPYWEPTPWGPFADLEKSDEVWARPLGLGRMVSSKERVAYLIDQAMLNFEQELFAQDPPRSYFAPLQYPYAIQPRSFVMTTGDW